MSFLQQYRILQSFEVAVILHVVYWLAKTQALGSDIFKQKEI